MPHLYPRLGTLLGLAIAAWCLMPEIQADLAGVRTMGNAEVMFVLSLPFSLLTWAAWLLPATELFSDGNEIPKWVGYVWMAVTPPLNWGLIGWLVARWLTRRSAASPGAST